MTDAYYADYQMTGRPYLTESQRQILQSAGRERVIASVCRLLSSDKIAASAVCDRYHELMEEIER